MLSKNKIKLINSLSQKKFRTIHKTFIAEGPKIVSDLMYSRFEVEEIFGINSGHLIIPEPLVSKFTGISSSDLKKISQLKTPNEVLALFKIPEEVFDMNQLKNQLTIVLDDIQDPGNLGTLIRIANWFGIKQIICSLHSTDVYNPKVIQATMGSIGAVELFYTDLNSFLHSASGYRLPVYGTVLNGDMIYEKNLENRGMIVFGNESKGISDSVLKFVTDKITIPSFGNQREKTDSLNIAISAAIICSEFRRRTR